jgi:ABC-type nitrate/sulfonate/bicarbonate transport system permease component
MGLILVVLIVWEIAALRINNPKLMPNLRYLYAHSLPSLAVFGGENGENWIVAFRVLVLNFLATLLRVSISFCMGSALGMLAGVSIYYIRSSKAISSWGLTVARSIPLFALIPLFLYWFSGQEIGIYLYIIFAVFVVVSTSTYVAVVNIAPQYIHQSRLMGASKFRMFYTIIFPAMQPELAGGLRNSLGLCWAFSLGAEYLSAKSGIGYLLYQSYLYADMGKLIIFAMVYAFCGWITFFGIRPLLQWMRRWV